MKFTESIAQRVMQEQVGMLGFARRQRGRCEVGKLESIGNPRVYGEGRSFRKALESAGIFYKNGVKVP